LADDSFFNLGMTLTPVGDPLQYRLLENRDDMPLSNLRTAAHNRWLPSGFRRFSGAFARSITRGVRRGTPGDCYAQHFA